VEAVNQSRPDHDPGWPRGWDEHRLQQLRRIAALPFLEKLAWLEEGQALAEAIAAARHRLAGPSQPDPTTR
jgi:hypothetical protein